MRLCCDRASGFAAPRGQRHMRTRHAVAAQPDPVRKPQVPSDAPVSIPIDNDFTSNSGSTETDDATLRFSSNGQSSPSKHQRGTVIGAASLVAGTAIGAGILALPAVTQVHISSICRIFLESSNESLHIH